jgi:invasion protein IalB
MHNYYRLSTLTVQLFYDKIRRPPVNHRYCEVNKCVTNLTPQSSFTPKFKKEQSTVVNTQYCYISTAVTIR